MLSSGHDTDRQNKCKDYFFQTCKAKREKESRKYLSKNLANKMPDEDCPICLESLNPSDELFPLPCYKCDYNFCKNCVETFERSSKDDFQEASDGSRQVKVYLACPQCRGKYPMDISEVVMLRKAHSVGSSLVDDDGIRLLDDSELNAGILSAKRDFSTFSKKRKVESAYGLYLKVMKDGNLSIPEETKEEAKTAFERLFRNISEDDDYSSSDGEPSPKAFRPDMIDETLFQGLEDSMGSDEKIFLTKLLTSGQPDKLTQAAMILNGILKMTMSGQFLVSTQSFQNASQKKKEQIAKAKKRYPLPSHMPGYFLIPMFDRNKKQLVLKDKYWDGKMTPPATSKRVFDIIYEKHYSPRIDPRPVVYVDAIRGKVGRLGLRKGDIITHVNDMEWTGNAMQLERHLFQIYENNASDVISVTVNASPETANFLKVRAEMLEKARAELL